MPPQPPPEDVRPETLQAVSRELTVPELPAAQAPAVAGLLNALADDMADFRRMDVGDGEPVLIYDPTGGAA